MLDHKTVHVIQYDFQYDFSQNKSQTKTRNAMPDAAAKNLEVSCSFMNKAAAVTSAAWLSGVILLAMAFITPAPVWAKKHVLEGSRAIDYFLELEAKRAAKERAKKRQSTRALQVQAPQQPSQAPRPSQSAAPAPAVAPRQKQAPAIQTQMLVPLEERTVKASPAPKAVKRNLAVPAEALPNSDNHRIISLYNIHTKETLTILYKKNGKYIPEAMKKINYLMRDWRRNEPTRMKPKLIDLLWELQTELKPTGPIKLISGYRSLQTNNMLRRTRGGQAKRSRHILGMAADVHFPGVPIKKLRHAAMRRQMGGVGYYPTSAIPFVHVDTGRVRHWPRINRIELAMIFPDGRTKHIPRGGPLRPRDLRIARARLARLKAKPVMTAKANPMRRRQLIAAVQKDLADLRKAANFTSLLWVNRTGNQDAWKTVALHNPAASTVQPQPARYQQLQSARPQPGHWRKLWVNRSEANRPLLMPDNVTFVWDQTSSLKVAPHLMTGLSRADITEHTPREELAYAPDEDEDHPNELFYRPIPLAQIVNAQSLLTGKKYIPQSKPAFSLRSSLFDNPEEMIGMELGRVTSQLDGDPGTRMLRAAARDIMTQNQAYRRRLTEGIAKLQ